jgi:hypothetical protein
MLQVRDGRYERAFRFIQNILGDNRFGVHENLLAVLQAHCAVLSGKSAFPGLGVVGQILHDPELRATFAHDLIAPRLAAIESILRAGVDSGELAADAVNAVTAKIGPALIIHHVLLTGTPRTRRDLIAIVAAVIGPPGTD